MTQRLYRSQADRMLGGVAGGMAEYLRIDPVIVRLLWVLGTVLTSGVGILIYVLMVIVTPTSPTSPRQPEAGAAADDADGNEAPEAAGAERTLPGERLSGRAGSGNAALLAGLVLIALGALALVGQFGWFDAWRLWPLILIAVGGVLIVNRRR